MSRARALLGGLALLAFAALVVGALLDLTSAMHAWLLGFVFISLAPPGALAMIMLGRLTRAPWAETFAVQLRGLASAAPVLWLLGLPIAILIGWTFPWMKPGGAPHHLHYYLSPLAFLIRAAIALGGWTALAFVVRSARGLDDLTAALALAFQGVVAAIIPVGWILSEQPGWITSDIGMLYVVLEVLAVAAMVLLFSPALPKKGADDIAGFLIGSTLGVMYLTFVAWLIDWYGDLPSRVGWWAARVGGLTWILAVVPFCLGLAAFAALAFGRRYRFAGASAIAGLALYCVWLFVPTLGPTGWFTAPAALIFHAAVVGLVVAGAFGPGQRPSEAVAHA